MVKYISVLDLGTSGVRMLVAKVADNGANHIIAKASASCRGIKKGKIENATEVTEAIRKSVRRIKEQTDITVKSTYVSMFGAYVECVKNTASIETGEGGIVTAFDVARLLDKAESVDLRDDEYLLGAVPVNFYNGNNVPLDVPVGSETAVIRADAQVFIGQMDFVEQITSCIKAADLEADGFIPLPVAMRDLIPEGENENGSTLLIDIGGSVTEYALYFQKGIYLSGSICLGGENITSDIAQVLNIKREEAETIKREYQIADIGLVTNDIDIAVFSLTANKQELVKVSKVVEIMQARIEDILSSVAGELDAEEVATDLIDRVILMGDGITGFSGLETVVEKVMGTKLDSVDFTRYTGMKELYTYSSGMIMYVSEMLPFGMNQSRIEKPAVPQEKTGNSDKGTFSTIKEKFSQFLEKIRD